MWTVYGSATDEFQAACPVSLFVRFSVPRTSSPLASLLSASDQRRAQSLTRAQHREPKPTQCARTRTARRPSARGKQGHESRTYPYLRPLGLKRGKHISDLLSLPAQTPKETFSLIRTQDQIRRRVLCTEVEREKQPSPWTLPSNTQIQILILPLPARP